MRKFSHMTLTSPNEKRIRVADIVRRFCHFLLWRGEFCFDVVGHFQPKKITPNCNALAKSIISYLWVSYYTFVFSWQCKTMLFTHKKHAVTSSECAHSITWYKQKRRRNRWASKQVSRLYVYGQRQVIVDFLSINFELKKNIHTVQDIRHLNQMSNSNKKIY